jgi:hypothetical protein
MLLLQKLLPLSHKTQDEVRLEKPKIKRVTVNDMTDEIISG